MPDFELLAEIYLEEEAKTLKEVDEHFKEWKKATELKDLSRRKKKKAIKILKREFLG